MKIKLFPQDQANHYFYGSQAAWMGAALGFALVMFLLHALVLALVGAAVAAIVAAYALGQLKEKKDAKENKAAAERGEPLPHAVEQSDVNATAVGASPVALFCIAAAGVLHFFPGVLL